MPIFKSKFALGQRVRYKLPSGDWVSGKIRQVHFFPECGPRYTIKSKDWWEVQEKFLTPVPPRKGKKG